MSEPLYRKGDEVEVVRRGVIVEVDPRDPARFGIGRTGAFGADAYFRTDDDKVRHGLVAVVDALVQLALKAVILDGDRVLMVRKGPDDEHQPGRWELPGGRMRAGESPDDALVREVFEEVGVEVVPGRPLAVWSWRLGDGPDAPTVVAVARLCTVAAGSAPDAVSAEHDRAAWVPVGDVLALNLIPSARGPITEALAQLDTQEKTRG